MNSTKSSKNLASIQTKYIDRNPIVQYANRRFLQTIDYFLRNTPAKTILDAGCGEGTILSLIKSLNQGSFLGLDYDLARLHEAKEDFSARLIQGDLHALPLLSGSFDLILCLEVLEHVGNPTIALQELHRLTNRFLLISVPHEPWWRIGNMLRLKYLRDWGNTPEHIHHWTRRGIKALVSENFRVLETRNPVLWTFILAEKKQR